MRKKFPKLAQMIKEKRVKLKLSKAALARNSKVSRQTIINMENHGDASQLYALYKVCRYLNISLDLALGIGGKDH